MSISAIKNQEIKALKTEPTQLILIISFLIACLYAVVQGAAYRHQQTDMTTTFIAEQNKSIEVWRDRLVAVDNGTTTEADDRWAGLAMDVSFPAVAAPGPLSDLSHGVSDVRPHTGRLSLWRSVDRLFGNYQVQSPIDTAAGSFDLAFVIIFVMPLLMIALSYDALSDDKELGRLGLVLSQPISVRLLVLTRLRVRFMAIAVILAVALAIGLVSGATDNGGISERLPYFTIWFLIATSYFLMWAAVITWAISLKLRGETTALLLAGIWIVNCLAGPASLSATAESLYPTPSRLAFLSEAREASNSAYKSKADIMQGMLFDHPDLTADNYSIPEYIRTAFLVTRTVDQSVAPVLNRFDEVQAERRDFLSIFQYASPAALTLQAFNLSAGTNLERHLRFERSVRDFKQMIAEEVERNVLVGQRLTLTEYDNLPRYQNNEWSIGQVIEKTAAPIAFLLIIASLLGTIALKNLGRLQTRILEP
ncbi:DUF3526 domain-containing protein [Kordiimonas aquimaris]|uniref:DUF3526 domain-containing protein n=1 Tax=Kordiimonas aquimaris TaxID=707591 RepID=UPI0021D1FB2B|nr:DUF3526 domain-containing protein [Kordiimonas aquimaris]